jgi:hypothetical protein
MNKQKTKDCLVLWSRLVETEKDFYSARAQLLSKCGRQFVVELVHARLQSVEDRATALGIVPLLTVEEQQQLFDALLSLASFSHGLTTTVREIILSLPRTWVIANIEEASEQLLKHDDYETYWGLLSLYIELDRDITLRLAQKAVSHADEDIKEAGEHFIKRLSSKSSLE